MEVELAAAAGPEMCLLLLLLGQLKMGSCVEELGLTVLELLLVVNGDLLLDHHLLLQVDLLLLLDQRVWLYLCVCGCTNRMVEEKESTQVISSAAGNYNNRRKNKPTKGRQPLHWLVTKLQNDRQLIGKGH